MQRSPRNRHTYRLFNICSAFRVHFCRKFDSNTQIPHLRYAYVRKGPGTADAIIRALQDGKHQFAYCISSWTMRNCICGEATFIVRNYFEQMRTSRRHENCIRANANYSPDALGYCSDYPSLVTHANDCLITTKNVTRMVGLAIGCAA